MTAVTRRGEAGLDVIWISRALVILHVAVGTGAAGQAVISIHVTLRALQCSVCSGQREPGAGVVEGGPSPRCRVMALLAGLGEIRHHVIRIRRPLVVLQVARHASRVGQVVVVVDVAVGALPRRHRV